MLLGIHYGLVLLFKTYPLLTDSYYQNGVFTFFRKGYDQTIGRFDFPFIYILLPLLILGLFLDLQSQKKRGLMQKMAYLFNYLSCLFFLFYFFWAYNYYSSSLSKRMNMEQVTIDKMYLIDRLEELSTNISELRMDMNENIYSDYRSQEIEDLVRPKLQELLKQYGYYTKSTARVKPLFEGALMRLRTSGIYISHVFEGHFDTSIDRTQWPFTIAHEMAHAYGVTDEKECNFLAYISCIRSNNDYVKYSALIAHWRYLAFALIKEDNATYQKLRSELEPKVIQDLDNINASITRFPELMPKSRDKIYNKYLETHGVQDGIKSYDKMVEMIAQWENI